MTRGATRNPHSTRQMPAHPVLSPWASLRHQSEAEETSALVTQESSSSASRVNPSERKDPTADGAEDGIDQHNSPEYAGGSGGDSPKLSSPQALNPEGQEEANVFVSSSGGEDGQDEDDETSSQEIARQAEEDDRLAQAYASLPRGSKLIVGPHGEERVVELQESLKDGEGDNTDKPVHAGEHERLPSEEGPPQTATPTDFAHQLESAEVPSTSDDHRQTEKTVPTGLCPSTICCSP